MELWTLRSSVLVVFNNCLLIDITDRSKISSNQKRFFIALSPFKGGEYIFDFWYINILYKIQNVKKQNVSTII